MFHFYLDYHYSEALHFNRLSGKLDTGTCECRYSWSWRALRCHPGDIGLHSEPLTMCSVRHSPMPSAPLLRAANASSGVSAFAITCICNSKLIQQALHVQHVCVLARFLVHQIASSSRIAANFVKYYSRLTDKNSKQTFKRNCHWQGVQRKTCYISVMLVSKYLQMTNLINPLHESS